MKNQIISDRSVLIPLIVAEIFLALLLTLGFTSYANAVGSPQKYKQIKTQHVNTTPNPR